MGRLRIWWGVLAIAILVVQGCTSATPPAPAGSAAAASAIAGIKKGGQVVYASIYDPRTLDPALDDAAFTLLALRQLYDGLVAQDDKGKIYPHLATSWDTSADNLTWTFHLRKGVTFHDGTAFNAAAVKFSLDRIIDQKTTSPARARFSSVISGVDVVDDSTVRITLKQLYAPFLQMMATSFAYVVSPAGVQKFGKDFTSNPVGTGPFTFVEWQKQDHVTLKANPSYAWAPPFLKNQGAPYLDTLILRQISEPTALGASMETGETQLLGFLDVANAERLNGQGNKEILAEAPSSGWLYYINTQKAPTDDLRVRQAIGYAIDNKTASQTPLWRGDGEPIFGPLNPTHPYASKTVAERDGFKYDPEKAKQLLDSAGWKVGADGIREKDGKKLLLIDVTNSETARYVGSAQIVQQQLRAVGIQTEIHSLTQATFSQAQARGEHNIAIRANVGDDPSAIFETMMSCAAVGVSGQNLSRYCDKNTDALLDQGRKEFDQTKRFAIYEQIQSLMLKQAVAVPFTSRRFIYEIRKDVDGFVYDQGLTYYAADLHYTK